MLLNYDKLNDLNYSNKSYNQHVDTNTRSLFGEKAKLSNFQHKNLFTAVDQYSYTMYGLSLVESSADWQELLHSLPGMRVGLPDNPVKPLTDPSS